jgi:DNA-binding NtrC family response regulator
MASYMLFAGSDPATRRLVEEAAVKLGFSCRVAALGAAFNAELFAAGQGIPVLIVLDLDTVEVDGLALLRELQKLSAPVVVLAGGHSATLARLALREGASDYLAKPVSVERVEVSMRNVLKISVLEDEIARLKRQAEGKLAWSDIIAISPEMQRALNLAKRAADLDIPVLVEGESGTGRELIARAIHSAGARSAGRFVALDLREHRMPGRQGPADMLLDALWDDADGGTLYIQEIGELGPKDQERLAQLLGRRGKSSESGEGASNVRLIASSSVDLIERVKNRQLRDDFYYLINVFPIWLPPLRDRPDDLAHLVWHYLARFAAEEGKHIHGIDGEALALLRAWSWPGNIRQLENAIYRAVILAEGDQIRVTDLPQIVAQVRGLPTRIPPFSSSRPREPYRGPAMFGSALTIAAPAPFLPPAAPIGIPAMTEEGEIRSLTEIEADLIRLALGHYRGHITEAARRLGIGRSTLYRKMREFGLDMRHNSV